MPYTVKHKYLETHQKDESKKEKSQKPVRIDDKTIILVDESISDSEAKENYLAKLHDRERKLRAELALRDRTRNQINKAILWD